MVLGMGFLFLIEQIAWKIASSYKDKISKAPIIVVYICPSFVNMFLVESPFAAAFLVMIGVMLLFP